MVKEPAFPQLENTRGSTSFHIPTPSTTKRLFFVRTAKDCNALPVNSPLFIPPKAFHMFILLLTGKVFDSLSFGLKSFIVHYHSNSDDAQQQLVKISVLDIPIKKT